MTMRPLVSVAKPHRHTKQGVVLSCYGFSHQLLADDRIENSLFPAMVPAVILEEGAEQKP
jgi:hypothetical protein